MPARSIGLTMLAARPVPAGISNLELWLRSDSGVGIIGGNVASWADLSGHSPARDALQATAGNRPAFTANVANGWPGLTFNGATSNRFLTGSLVGVPLITTLWAVARMSTGTQSGGILDVTSAPGHTNTGSLLVQNSTVREYRFGGSLAANVVGYTFTSTLVMFNLGRYTGLANTSPQIFEKAISKAANNSGIGQPIITQYRVGRLFDDVFPFQGDILELAAYSKAVSLTEEADLSNYAVQRYAIA